MWGLISTPIRDKYFQMFLKQNPAICCPQETQSNYKTQIGYELKDGERYTF